MFETTTKSRIAPFARALHELWFYERASAHVLAGWIVKIPEFALKKGCGRALHQKMSTAHQVERALASLRNAADVDSAIPRAARERMIEIDRLDDPHRVLERIFLDLGPYLAELHERALEAGDEILDAPVLDVLSASLPRTRAQSRWAAAELGRSESGPAPWRALWNPADTTAEDALWAPLDRVPEAVRPAHVDRGIPGALRPLPLDANTDRAGIALILHNNINGEYTTMELVSRCSYEHPEMRSDFHLDMARHASDEARHAEAFERLAEGYGVRYGDLPVFTYTYDALYQFSTCMEGSKDELLWRLLLRATVQEGTSLDDLIFQAKRREHLGQWDIADTFRSILADEIFHVRGGLKWTRELCDDLGKKPLAERERARGLYNVGILVRRNRFLKEHPDLAAREAAYQKELHEYRRQYEIKLPVERVLQRELRQVAGFTEEDIAQAAKWEF